MDRVCILRKMKRFIAFVGQMTHDGGPSSNRFINLGVFVGFTIMMLKLAWVVQDASDLNIWFWATATTYAVYGMGTATFNKWLDIIRERVGSDKAP